LNSNGSRRENRWNNVVVDAIFASLKKELIYDRLYYTIADVKVELFDYIKSFYNRK